MSNSWFHCNGCLVQPDKGIQDKFWLSSCYHLFCSVCREQINTLCPICQKSGVKFIHIDAKMPSACKNLFRDIGKILFEQQGEKKQLAERQRRQLESFLEEQNKETEILAQQHQAAVIKVMDFQKRLQQHLVTSLRKKNEARKIAYEDLRLNYKKLRNDYDRLEEIEKHQESMIRVMGKKLEHQHQSTTSELHQRDHPTNERDTSIAKRQYQNIWDESAVFEFVAPNPPKSPLMNRQLHEGHRELPLISSTPGPYVRFKEGFQQVSRGDARQLYNSTPCGDPGVLTPLGKRKSILVSGGTSGSGSQNKRVRFVGEMPSKQPESDVRYVLNDLHLSNKQLVLLQLPFGYQKHGRQ